VVASTKIGKPDPLARIQLPNLQKQKGPPGGDPFLVLVEAAAV